MDEGLKNNQKGKSLKQEINEGFPFLSIFVIPIDFNYDEISNSKNNVDDEELSIEDNYYINFLDNDLINDFPKLLDKNENSCGNNLYKKDKIQNSLKKMSSLNNILFKDEEEQKEDKISINPYLINYNMNSLNDDSIFTKIQNCNINIYKPCINFVNICYPGSSFLNSSYMSKSDNNNIKTIKKNNSLEKDEKNKIEIQSGNHFRNKQLEKNEINSYVNKFALKNNNKVNLYKDNLNKSENNSPLNYSEIDFKNNINYNYNNLGNQIINKNTNIEKENNNKTKAAPKKKNKKKKKKKVNDEYTFEMFGRRGWICQGCNNFNYESRKQCNRCKIPKKPVKKDIIMDFNGNIILHNMKKINHKDDWNCYNCGNINYAFRLNCNRCQMKREDSMKENEEE